jgi:hypothetical protein
LANAPLSARDARLNASDLPDGTSEIFLLKGLDAKQPAGQITARERLRTLAGQFRETHPAPSRVANHQAKISRFPVRAPRARPGNDSKQKRGGIAPAAFRFLYSLVQAPRTPFCQAQEALAGDPSEVTALGKRHWITSFRC